MKNKRKTLKEIWEQVPAGYYHQMNFFQKLWHREKIKIFRRLLTGKEKKVLEIGCADGYLIGALGKYLPQAKIFAIDISSALITYAKKRYPKISFLVADAHKLPFPQEKFDLIICAETIEHVKDPQKVLLEIKKKLNSSGKLIIEVDTHSLLFRIVWFFWVNFGKGKVWQDAHLNSFNSEKLENLLKASGFRIEKKIISHFGMAMTFLASQKNN